jgi:hypothetical protein
LIDRANILLSVQRALLGAIGTDILAICISIEQTGLEVVVFAERFLSLAQYEALETAATEIMADFSSPIAVGVRVVEQAKQPLECQGIWVFVRLNCLIR